MKEDSIDVEGASFLSEWKRRVREGFEILGPIRGPVLVITHLPVLLLEAVICACAKWRLGHFPYILNHESARADVAIAVGLNTTPYTVWPMGVFLNKVFGYRILFIQTPLEGNVVPSSEIVSLNRKWFRKHTGQRPLYAIGFSYGGFDLIWQLVDLIKAHPDRDIRTLYTVNTPLRGSALARVIKASGAREMEPDSENLPQTHRAIEHLEARGVFVHHNASFVDLVARKGDTRPPRPADSVVPSRWQRYVIWPALIVLSLWRWQPTLPTWWSHTLPQIGHKATMNPLVWIVLGLRIRRSLKGTFLSS